jgi:hypothetical protein
MSPEHVHYRNDLERVPIWTCFGDKGMKVMFSSASPKAGSWISYRNRNIN